MYIFNLNSIPYIIVTEKELLFRHYISDEEMQRHPIENIERISTEHSYDENKELLLYLRIKISEKNSPILLTVSSLETPVEEFLSILSQELYKKTTLSLPSAKWIRRRKNKGNKKKLFLTAIVILAMGLYGIHKMLIPSLESLDSNALKKRYEADPGRCSVRAKVALPLPGNNTIKVKTYCGVLGIWKDSASKTISKQFLETEFSSLHANDYLAQAKESYDNNKSDTALNQIANTLYLDPENYQAYFLLSKIQERRGFTKQALISLFEAAALNPNSSSIADAISSLYLKEKNYKEAYIYANKAAALETSATRLIKLAKIETNLQMVKEAIEHYERSLQKDPDNLDVLTELSLFYWELKDFKKVADKLQKIYELYPAKVLNFLNYYEITLLTPTPLGIKDEETFLEEYKGSKEAMMIYDMLNIIHLSIKNTDTQNALILWSQTYEDEKLDWPLQRLRAWLDTRQLDIEHMQHIQNTIGFFIAYQQAYKINHSEVD